MKKQWWVVIYVLQFLAIAGLSYIAIDTLSLLKAARGQIHDLKRTCYYQRA